MLLNRTKYIELLNLLRKQMRNDTVVSRGSYPTQFLKAAELIDGLAMYVELIPEINSVIGTLRQAVRSFYSETSNRGWAQQFVLQDIDKLEALYPGDRE